MYFLSFNQEGSSIDQEMGFKCSNDIWRNQGNHKDRMILKMILSSLPQTNKLAPDNQWLEDEISSWDGIFQGSPVAGHVGDNFA